MPPTAADFLQRLERTSNGVRGLLPAWRNLSQEEQQATATAFMTAAILQVDVQVLNVSPTIAHQMRHPFPADLVERYLDVVVQRRATQTHAHRHDYDEVDAEHSAAHILSEFMEDTSAAWSASAFDKILSTELYDMLDASRPSAAFAAWWKSLSASGQQLRATHALQGIKAVGFDAAPYTVREKTFKFIDEQLLTPLPDSLRLKVIKSFVDDAIKAPSATGLEELTALNKACSPCCGAIQGQYPAQHSWLQPLADPAKSGSMALALSESQMVFPGKASEIGGDWGTGLGNHMRDMVEKYDVDSYAMLMYVAIIQIIQEQGLLPVEQFNDLARAFANGDSQNLDRIFSKMMLSNDDWLMVAGVECGSRAMAQFKASCQQVFLLTSTDAQAPASPKPRF